MSPESPTRSRLLALRIERQAMQEGHAFLDEKCLLLAAALFAELERQRVAAAVFADAVDAARTTLRAALLHHGLEGLSVYPAPSAVMVQLELRRDPLLGLLLNRTQASIRSLPVPPAAYPSAPAEACRAAFARLAAASAELAAVNGNLRRLSHEYQRSVRRACALHDVILPEVDAAVRDIDGRLEDMEREEALAVRSAARRPGPASTTR